MQQLKKKICLDDNLTLTPISKQPEKCVKNQELTPFPPMISCSFILNGHSMALNVFWIRLGGLGGGTAGKKLPPLLDPDG